MLIPADAVQSQPCLIKGSAVLHRSYTHVFHVAAQSVAATGRRGRKPRNPIPTPASIVTSPGSSEIQLATSAAQATSIDVPSITTAIYFLAPDIFSLTRLELPRPDLPIAVDVYEQVGDVSRIRSIADKYFVAIHTWMPIVSKKGFRAYLLNPLARRRTELYLLALCMKLSCTPAADFAEEGPENFSLYQTAKRFCSEVEAAGLLSIHCLQAEVLIAIFEIGQAVYPAAYLTVGRCARYGTALGYGDFGKTVNEHTKPNSSIDGEEGRRVWWGITMLDRYVNLSNPTRPLAIKNPGIDAELPLDDDTWENSSSKSEECVQISNGFTLKMGFFSRLAQATYLLGQAFDLLSSDSADATECLNANQGAQLRRTLQALINIADEEASVRQLYICAQSMSCFSSQ
ncbi:fungal specific transcription factor [Fusarium acutatum]|uniref:Fungal specific transcription factor n=1 Tax=Fusarium acutatum TaxID=78861 RepID=A0A8H4JVC2_9HYPO|nr:fungal specific transcription factor [Fusarium acutatum]